ncbi:MAG: dTDP-glucose 4,6 dehydratase [Candidatus Methanofastidiosum methylothiophilum]|uniref:GDP-L-fucose synthase n=1 Tax=Candidatus Methanofastidiosum methylothiophilum TaxID=1705564 RepID=A0A150IY57_9EURY|nr:MAG: dTDP-glucose 4,6 dehydratase [Candidatus Methanofastidiosum methylthiophilus]KYC48477.1 MAG: dTDP-glucose 4,6 dehydratase [Candidatus Methanofastidiosum methylthiophilus]KYC49919.1 MAG: dTDP-glucose 4,6 dehydratase [Candidatus Methanofastidiosum methylthiophilus]
MTYLSNKRILVTGGAGFLGSHLVTQLKEKVKDPSQIRIPRSKDIDLRNWDNCLKVLDDVDIVIHLAAKVGGIGYNQTHPAELFYDNAIMGIQLLEAARRKNIEKFVIVGTVCAYPKFTPVPFREDEIWNGYPEETNAPYGLAKKMLLVQSQAYREQYGFNSIYVIPVNLYGPGDNFNPESSHVIPALIKKFVDAKSNGEKEVEIWGTGNASREFIYVEDAARAILLATEKYNYKDPINIGSGKEITIKELVALISEEVGYNDKIKWDKNKPDGQPRRCLNIDKAKKDFGFKAKVPIGEGIKRTVDWYIKNYY